MYHATTKTHILYTAQNVEMLKGPITHITKMKERQSDISERTWTSILSLTTHTHTHTHTEIDRLVKECPLVKENQTMAG